MPGLLTNANSRLRLELHRMHDDYFKSHPEYEDVYDRWMKDRDFEYYDRVMRNMQEWESKNGMYWSWPLEQRFRSKTSALDNWLFYSGIRSDEENLINDNLDIDRDADDRCLFYAWKTDADDYEDKNPHEMIVTIGFHAPSVQARYEIKSFDDEDKNLNGLVGRLAEYTRGQISDGIGESFEQQSFDHETGELAFDYIYGNKKDYTDKPKAVDEWYPCIKSWTDEDYLLNHVAIKMSDYDYMRVDSKYCPDEESQREWEEHDYSGKDILTIEFRFPLHHAIRKLDDDGRWYIALKLEAFCCNEDCIDSME